MSHSSVDDALVGYRRFHRALLNSTARKWRDLDISMQQVRAMHVLRDEGEVAIGRLTELIEGSQAHMRRWMSSLSPDELDTVARAWNLMAKAAGEREKATI